MCELGFVWAVQPKPKPRGHVGGTPGQRGSLPSHSGQANRICVRDSCHSPLCPPQLSTLLRQPW